MTVASAFMPCLPGILAAAGAAAAVVADSAWAQALTRYLEVALLFPVVVLLEWLLPADRRQKLFSASTLTDFTWAVFSSLFHGLFLAGYITVVEEFFNAHLAFLRVDAMAAWPVPVAVLIWFLVRDLLAWFRHWLRHKVPVLWDFHTVHHAQRRMTMFTSDREHPVEHIVGYTLTVLPALPLQVPLELLVVFEAARSIQTKFNHSNVRISFGWLRHVFVTPQYHRLHHSVEHEHQDRNFGIMLTIWDRLFGTMRLEGGYPETGVTDTAFPHERNVVGVPAAFVRQLIYPFRRIYRRLAGLPLAG